MIEGATSKTIGDRAGARRDLVSLLITRCRGESVQRLAASSFPDCATVTGVVRSGEHACEVAWRLASELFASGDACVSFHRLSSTKPLGSTVSHHFFQADLEDDFIDELPAGFVWVSKDDASLAFRPATDRESESLGEA